MYKLNKHLNTNNLFNTVFKGFARNVKNNTNFTYKIQKFIPNDSKYSIKSINTEITIEGVNPNDISNEIENETVAPSMPQYLTRQPRHKKKEDNNFSSISDNIIKKQLVSGKKMVLPRKKTIFKPSKEERLKQRQERQFEEEEKEKKELMKRQNNDTAVDRNDQKYIAQQKQLISRQLTTIKRETMMERRKLFNSENLIDFETPERLSKRLARLGITSRKQAEKLIKLGMVKVDGKTVSENVPVDDKNHIQVYGKQGYKTPIPENTKIWLFHKPAGLVSTYTDPRNRPTIYSYLKHIKFDIKHYIIVVSLYFNTKGQIGYKLTRVNDPNE
jgi:hypothetical protein